MSQTCLSMWAKAQGAIVFPLDLGNKRIPCKLLNRLSLCWEKQRRNLKNVPLLSRGKKTLSSLRWLGRRRAERSGEMENIRRKKEVLQTNIQITILASTIPLKSVGDCETFSVLQGYSHRFVDVDDQLWFCALQYGNVPSIEPQLGRKKKGLDLNRGLKARHWSFCGDLETDSVWMNPKASGYSSS